MFFIISKYHLIDVRYFKVSRRAAQLAACGLSVLLNHINESNSTIAVDGSLYRFHPKFKKVTNHKYN